RRADLLERGAAKERVALDRRTGGVGGDTTQRAGERAADRRDRAAVAGHGAEAGAGLPGDGLIRQQADLERSDSGGRFLNRLVEAANEDLAVVGIGELDQGIGTRGGVDADER